MKQLSPLLIVLFSILMIHPVFSQDQLALINVDEDEIETELNRVIIQNQLNNKEFTSEELPILRENVREGIIMRKLLVSLALHRGITLETEEVDRLLTEMKGAYPDEEWNKVLVQQLFTKESFRKALEDSLLIDRVLDLEVLSKISVSDGEIQAYYDSHTEDFATEHGTVPLTEVKKYIRDTLLAMKGQQEVSRFMDDLYARAMFVEE